MNTENDFPDRILTKSEARKLLGLSESGIDRLTDLPKVKLSAGRVGYRQSDVLAWIRSRPLVAA